MNRSPKYSSRRPQNSRRPRPQGPSIRQVAVGQVEVAAWFLCICRVASAKRAQVRQELIEWALTSQMSAAALVELAHTMAKSDRRFNELRSEMTRRGDEAYRLEQAIEQADEDADTTELEAKFEAAKAKHETAGGNKRGAVLRMTDEQMAVVKRWGLVLFGEPQGYAEKRVAGALIGRGRMHIRTTKELLARFLDAEDLAACKAEYEAAGTQPATDDSAVTDLPAPTQADKATAQPAAVSEAS